MSGGRILLALLALACGLAYWAIRGPADAGLARGTEETDAAFARVEEQLRALQPDYEWITGLHQGLRLQLRQSHEHLVDSLAELKDDRVAVATDPDLADRERLEELRAIVERADMLLADALAFDRRVSARVEFMRSSTPLLEHAEALRDALLAATADAPPDDEKARRVSHLAGSYAELRDRCKLADSLINQNPTQGKQMAGGILSALRSLIDEFEALAKSLGIDVPPRPEASEPG